METKSGVLFLGIVLFFVKTTNIRCQSFDDLKSGDIEPEMKRKTLFAMRMAVNSSEQDNIEAALVLRYPELLSIAVRVATITENETHFNETSICMYIRQLLRESNGSCGESINLTSACHLSSSTKKELLDNLLKICAKKNVTRKSELPTIRKLPTEYLFLAVKVLARTAMIGYERSCRERRGTLDSERNACMMSSTTQNASNYKDGISMPNSMDHNLFIISLTGNIISIIFLCFLLITYIILDKYKTVPGRSTMCLSCAIICTCITQILVAYHNSNHVFCITLGVLLHWFFLSTFIWMSSLAYDYFITFHRLPLTSSSRGMVRFRTYSFAAVALPTLAVVACLALDIPNNKITKYGAEGRCFIVGFWTNLFAFVVPIALLLSVNIALLCYTVNDIRVLKRSINRMTAINRKETFLTILAIKIAVLVGVAWVMAFVDAFVPNIIVKYIFTVIVTFQGVFVYLTFGYFFLMIKILKGTVTGVRSSGGGATTRESRF